MLNGFKFDTAKDARIVKEIMDKFHEKDQSEAGPDLDKVWPLGPSTIWASKGIPKPPWAPGQMQFYATIWALFNLA